MEQPYQDLLSSSDQQIKYLRETHHLTLHFYVKADSATDVTATVNEKTDSYDLGSMEPDANGQYVISVALAAAQMTEEITLDFVKNGASVLQKIYSIRGYADAILEGNYSAKTKELVRHMLNYGAAAQQYFGVNTEKLANAGYEITEEVTLPAEYEAIAVSGSIAGMQFYGASLVFDNKIAVRYYFTGSVDGVSYGDYEVIEKNGMHYVEVPGINPQDYAKSIAITATKGEESMTVSYSPLNYIIRMSEKGSDDLKTLINALYGYHAAAVEYVNNAGFFGSAYGYETDSQMDLIADTGANTGTVSVANDGISFGYIQDFREENFYFEAKFHANNVLETENWPKFGLFVQGENVQDAFYVDMNRERNASVVGRTESIDGTFDWENTKTARVDNMAFSAEGEKVTLGVLKDGKHLYLFVNGNYALTAMTNAGVSAAGIFSFNTGLTVTNYRVVTDGFAQLLEKIPAAELEKGDTFQIIVLDRVLTYQVDFIKVIEPTNISDLQIIEGGDYCTLFTCTPYGINSHRLLVRGHRIPNLDGDANVMADAMLVDRTLVAIAVAAVMLLILLIHFAVTSSKWYRERRMKKRRKKK